MDTTTGEGMPPYLIAFIALASLLLLISFSLFIFVLLNGWIIVDMKPVRAIKFFGFKKEGKYLLLTFTCKFKYRKPSGIYSTKKEAQVAIIALQEKDH
ncbi:MAG: hypothetical protein K6G74_00130 [Bacilli bacterium]|nr:hypothetical protein [Bacilli bacterium]